MTRFIQQPMSMNSRLKRAPRVRLIPGSDFDATLTRASQMALVVTSIIAVVFALSAGEYFLAPVATGIVVGLMLGPLAAWLERLGVGPAWSAAAVFVVFIAVVGMAALVVVGPLTTWMGRLPQIWTELQQQLSQLRQPLEAIRSARTDLRSMMGEGGLAVSVDEASPVESAVTFAPALAAQILIFLASFYFFVATRHRTRTAVLRLCMNRRLRWRIAHVFRDVEFMISRYLLSITGINIMEGALVGTGLWLAGIPSALMWGALAAVSNFLVFIGPLSMTLVLFGVGIMEFDTLLGAVVPPLIYQSINFVEAQFVTPLILGRTLTLNPFLVILSLIFWIWLWGAVGGFIAIPALLVCYAFMRNVFPMLNETGPQRASRQPTDT